MPLRAGLFLASSVGADDVLLKTALADALVLFAALALASNGSTAFPKDVRNVPGLTAVFLLYSRISCINKKPSLFVFSLNYVTLM